MTYGKGDYTISVMRFDDLEKRKGLYIGAGNTLLKVASFASDEKADMFCKWLEYFFGTGDEPEEDA